MRLVRQHCRWPFLAGLGVTGYLMLKVGMSITGENGHTIARLSTSGSGMQGYKI